MTRLLLLIIAFCQSDDLSGNGDYRSNLSPRQHLALAESQAFDGKVAEALIQIRYARAIDPLNQQVNEGLLIIRSHVMESCGIGSSSSIQPESEWYPGWLYSPVLFALGFFAWCIVCAALTRWWQVRRRRWLIIASVMVPLALIPPLNELVRHMRQKHDRAAPPVVIAKDTVLRAGNGPDYPSKINLPYCAECRKVGERGDWLQVEFASGLTGWIEKQAAIVASISQ